jgi:hypothetical protein
VKMGLNRWVGEMQMQFMIVFDMLARCLAKRYVLHLTERFDKLPNCYSCYNLDFQIALFMYVEIKRYIPSLILTCPRYRKVKIKK